MATERAIRAREISYDLTVAGMIESWIEFSPKPGDEALLPEVLSIRKRIGLRQMTETRWMDRGRLEDVKAEMDEVTQTRPDHHGILDDIRGYLDDLQKRYG